MENNLMEKYAELVVKVGVNLQHGQLLVINSPLECAEFARAIAGQAYAAGAKDVIISWKDELFAKLRYVQAPQEVFGEFPDWQKQFYIGYAQQGAAFVSIAASDPELLKDVQPERVAMVQKVSNTALAPYRERLMSNKNAWCVVSIPTAAWAQKVFPGESPAAAVEKLWQAIFKTVRVEESDVVAAWRQHTAALRRRAQILNDHQFRLLRYKNSLGTDLTAELPEGHIWLGGAEHTAEGVEFIANMPTEEIFTMPKKTGVNGRVVSSMPLNYNGNLIEDFSLTFKDGKVTEFSAQKGYEVLKQLIETDEGSAYLGEVALVPYDSPISNAKILYFNTLFDENASCHLALGKAYPICLQGGENMSREELAQRGVNDSLTHVDFMIGTADLEITGVTADGREIPIFVNGNFAQAAE